MEQLEPFTEYLHIIVTLLDKYGFIGTNEDKLAFADSIDGTYQEFMDNGTPRSDWPAILERELLEFRAREGAEYFAKQH
ncbi:hypothetical protein [Enterobacter phage F20]|uniref:Uncharacterized protein n=1 Tax=Enterobacter phage F20 TaxID=2886900 RepID=G5DMG7_9CAUD|nr:hypothetical protein FLA17_gp22 [Enterobacter phage F20]AEQ39195.1 hypothetical protein [Enterobacter phage F20]